MKYYLNKHKKKKIYNIKYKKKKKIIKWAVTIQKAQTTPNSDKIKMLKEQMEIDKMLMNQDKEIPQVNI